MKKIAITGLMGAGKSSCSNLLRQLGYDVEDCDQISHQLTQKDEEGYKQVVQKFTTEILDENKEIHRPTLANLIFKDLDKKKQLESILHPLILQEVNRRAQRCEKSLFFVEVPLLFEAGMESFFDEVICVTASMSSILERLQQNRKMTPEQIKQRWAVQMSQEEKSKRSSFVIDNNQHIEDISRQLLPWLDKMEEEENGTKS